MIGDLRDYGQIKAKTVTRSATGAEVIVWTTLFNLFADIQGLSGREFFAAGGEHSEVTSKITVRYTNNIKPSMRFCCGNRVFDIMAILPHKNRAYMYLMCKEDQ